MNWKKMGKRLLFPHPAFVWLLWPIAAALLVYSVITCESTDVISIIADVLAFYALTIVVLRVPSAIRYVKRFQRENPYAARITADVQLRNNIVLQGAFAFNAIYAVFQLGLGLKHRSVWFYSMAGYYFLLAGMRLILVRYTRRYTPGEELEIEWRKYRLCGVLLLLITFALMIFIIYFVRKIRVFRHHEITTIAMAAYTFVTLTRALINVARYRDYGSPAYSAAKAISLVSAMVSLLSLENAMLTEFGQGNSERFRQLMLGFTGVAVILAVQSIALYMIIHAGKKLRSIHNSERGVE